VGTSDADTSKIIVSVAPGAFSFRPHPGAAFAETHAFDQAIVRGRVTKPAIENGKIVVRLQGVDAPELHYRPSALIPKAQQTKKQRELYLKFNEEYRQKLAETATTEIARQIGLAGPSPVACVVTTAVDDPTEVFDTYGRFVGDILVHIGGQDVDINTWLLTQGWAFPSFYNSMTNAEILRLTFAANEAWEHDRGVWPHQLDFAKKGRDVSHA
jgi:endonuclease YncB( thermonuclease family)